MGDDGCGSVSSVSRFVCLWVLFLMTGDRPDHAMEPAWLLATALPRSPLRTRPSTPPAASSRKRSVPDDDVTEVDVALVKCAKTDRGLAVGSPSRKKRLEEEGLVLLESATNGVVNMDGIEFE